MSSGLGSLPLYPPMVHLAYELFAKSVVQDNNNLKKNGLKSVVNCKFNLYGKEGQFSYSVGQCNMGTHANRCAVPWLVVWHWFKPMLLVPQNGSGFCLVQISFRQHLSFDGVVWSSCASQIGLDLHRDDFPCKISKLTSAKRIFRKMQGFRTLRFMANRSMSVLVFFAQKSWWVQWRAEDFSIIYPFDEFGFDRLWVNFVVSVSFPIQIQKKPLLGISAK